MISKESNSTGTRYDKNFKTECVQAFHSQRENYKSESAAIKVLAERFSVSAETLRRWIKMAESSYIYKRLTKKDYIARVVELETTLNEREATIREKDKQLEALRVVLSMYTKLPESQNLNSI